MNKGLFITGSDTGVGKTFITAGLTLLFKSRGLDTGVMKPVASGCRMEEGAVVSQDVVTLRDIAGIDDDMELINPYRFIEPLSPNYASKKQGIEVDMRRIRDSFCILSKRHDVVLVEGIGGLMTPISNRYTVADLIRYLNLPAIIVVSKRLGAINHTLLSISKAKDMEIGLKGIILNETEPVSEGIDDSIKDELNEHTDIPVIGDIPYCGDESPDDAWLNGRIDIDRLIG